MSEKKAIIIELIISIISVGLMVFGVMCFNNYLIMKFPLGVRMVLVIITYLSIAIVPFLIVLIKKEKLSEFGICKENILKQIIIGLIIACVMSLFITLIPILIFGKENLYSSSKYKYVWQYIFEFFYLTFGVALTEEFIFRGYLLNRFKKLFKSNIFPIIITSVLFGFFHILYGNYIQVIITAFIGLILVLCRDKIKNCTLFSLIIAHGVYDWLIIIITAIL